MQFSCFNALMMHRTIRIGTMVKERKTARELASMITSQIGVDHLDIAVRSDHAFGWQPTVVFAQSNALGFQRRAEEIAQRLRVQFDLRD